MEKPLNPIILNMDIFETCSCSVRLRNNLLGPPRFHCKKDGVVKSYNTLSVHPVSLVNDSNSRNSIQRDPFL